MYIHDATEIAYNNGKTDAVSRVIEKLMEIKTEPGTDAHRTVSELMEWVKTL